MIAEVKMYATVIVPTAISDSFDLLMTAIMISKFVEYLNILNTLNTLRALASLTSLSSPKPLLITIKCGNIDNRSMIARSVKGYLITANTNWSLSL